VPLEVEPKEKLIGGPLNIIGKKKWNEQKSKQKIDKTYKQQFFLIKMT
jgi:hypothetical protein